MLKRINAAVMCVLLMCAGYQIIASEETKLEYRITFDSKEDNESEIIQSVLEIYHGLTKTVKRSDRAVIVRQSLEKFELTEQTVVRFDAGVVQIVMGDGKGSEIEGTFHVIECVPEIETSSWILEQLGLK